MGIFWLASYPKSGNTWIRALLANYFHGGKVSLNDLGYDGIANRCVFDELLGLPSANLRLEEIELYYPAVCRMVRDDADDAPGFVKVHAANLLNIVGERLFPADAGAAICIVRNPLDVAASLVEFFGWQPHRVARMVNDHAYVLNRSGHDLNGMLPERLLSWSEHVQSWIDAPEPPVHLVRFEDLHADAEQSLMRLLDFTGVAIDSERARMAVQQASFDRLRAAEREHGVAMLPGRATAPFFRRGEVGAWRDELPMEFAREIVQCHRATMLRLGYGEEVAEVEQSKKMKQ